MDLYESGFSNNEPSQISFVFDNQIRNFSRGKYKLRRYK
jgi:hypothetical protein